MKKKPKSSYDRAVSGEVIRLPVPSVWHMACCDCGLDHLILVSESSKKEIQLAVYRDDSMTIAHRSAIKFDCVPRGRK